MGLTQSTTEKRKVSERKLEEKHAFHTRYKPLADKVLKDGLQEGQVYVLRNYDQIVDFMIAQDVTQLVGVYQNTSYKLTGFTLTGQIPVTIRSRGVTSTGWWQSCELLVDGTDGYYILPFDPHLCDEQTLGRIAEKCLQVRDDLDKKVRLEAEKRRLLADFATH